jgi:putative tricarboxylic transport membrane protein
MDSVVLQGLAIALAPSSMLMIVIGVFIGIVIGIIPGIGAGVGLALLLPLMFSMPPILGLMLLLALWAADGYGASITSILINVPGGAGAVATCFDGYPMARQGKGGEAIGLSMGASMVAGILGTVVLMLVAPTVAMLAVKIGPGEYTLLGVLGITLIGGLSSKEPLKGLISGCIGLMTSFIGYDLITGYVRYNFGQMYLFNGVDLTLALIGVFAIAALVEAGQEGGSVSELGKMTGSVLKGFFDAFRKWPSTLRGSLVGIVLGCLPGIGITLSSMTAYDVERRFSKHPEMFGHGAPEGVIGPEAANNSCQPAALIPTLTLGIPAGSTSAIFLGALIVYGVQPGMTLFTQQGGLVWALMWGIIIASIAYVIVGLAFADFWAKLTLLPLDYIVALTLVTCFIGAFSNALAFEDLVVAFLYGVLGIALTVLKYPPAPAVLGVVLGPILEKNYFRALLVSGGSYDIFFGSPLAIILWVLLISLVAGPTLMRLIRRKPGAPAGTAGPSIDVAEVGVKDI